MIAIWMGYTLATGVLLLMLGALLDRLLRIRRWPTRGVWMATMIGIVTLGVAALALPNIQPAGELSSSESQRMAPIAAFTAVYSGNIEGSTSGSVFAATRREVTARMADIAQRVDKKSASLSRWNSLFATLWFASTAVLAAIVLAAVRRDFKVRRQLQQGDVHGTPVLLADNLGPAVLGPHAPAIVLPRWMLDLDTTLLRLVLCHEREHVRARDPLMLLVGILSIVLMPWHLPLWYCWRRLRLAVETDCDARVLRAYPDVRRYAQLLLLLQQRNSASTWTASRFVATSAALQPEHSHLASRIMRMTESRRGGAPLQVLSLIVGIVVIATAAYALPRPAHSRAAVAEAGNNALTDVTALLAQPGARTPEQAPQPSREQATSTSTGGGAQPAAQGGLSAMIAERTAPANSQMRSVINITSATLYTDSGDSTSIALSQVLVHASGPSRIGTGTHERALAMGDTLLVYGLPPTSLDVTEGEVHVEMVVDGTLRLAGHVTGGGALRLSATCRHIIFFKGGHGVRCG